ncbi:MAG: hypothetical protein IJH37_03250 [Clostridia bacterium]|nr:hypothetical protein [Clostridia bacterium]
MKLKKYISMILAAACFMPQAAVSLATEPEITANETSVAVKNAPDGSSLIMAFYDDIILTDAKLFKVSGMDF